jgi:hypothetical protein
LIPLVDDAAEHRLRNRDAHFEIVRCLRLRMTSYGSESNFLTSSMLVACAAAPAARRPHKAAPVLVSKEHQRLMAPVAPHHMRIAEEQVFAEEGRSIFFFSAVERVAAEYASGSGADGLPVRAHFTPFRKSLMFAPTR